MKIQIAVTFWNRLPMRLDCLSQVYESVEKYMYFGSYDHEWIVSCESDRCVDKNKVDKFLKSKSNITYKWKTEKASLSSNLNTVLKMCTAPLIFYLQDDWEMREPLDLEKDANFLIESDYDMIRYRYCHPQRDKISLVSKELNLYNVHHNVHNLYSDQPHLKKISFHEKYGYFPESTWKGYDSGDCEMGFNGRLRKTNAKILFKDKSDRLFYHTSGSSEHSTLKEKWAHFQRG